MTTGITTKAASSSIPGDEAVLRLRGAGLRFGDRVLWDGLDLDVHVGEFIAVLGANGSGKSSLLKAILGQLRLSAGTAEFLGQPIRRGNRRIGYVPQQKLADDGVPTGLDDLGVAVVQAVDAVADHRSIPDEVQQRIVDAHGTAGVVELVVLCGLYALMGYTCTAFDVAVEDGLPAPPF